MNDDQYEKISTTVLGTDKDNFTLSQYVKKFVSNIKKHIDDNYQDMIDSRDEQAYLVMIELPDQCSFKLDHVFLEQDILFFQHKGFILRRKDEKMVHLVYYKDIL